jgi:hypothetical protein
VDINNLRDFEKKAIDFINTINQNYKINDDGFLYFPEKHIAISLNEKYESSNIYKPKDYFTNITNKYRDNGIRLMNLFDWRIDHADSWEKMKMLLITAVGNPKKIMSRKCTVKQITNAEARPLNEKFHTMGHRNAPINYGLFYKGQLVEIMSFGHSGWNRNLKSEGEYELLRGCMGSLNTSILEDDPDNLYFVAGGPTRLLTHFIRDYNPNVIFSYCEKDLFGGSSYLAAGMHYLGNTGETKWWLCNEIDPETGKMGLIIPRNPSRYKELKERSNNQVIWTCGSDRYAWIKPGYKYQGKGKEFLDENI